MIIRRSENFTTPQLLSRTLAVTFSKKTNRFLRHPLSPANCLLSAPKLLQFFFMQKRMSIQLMPYRSDRAGSRRSLGELLEQAIAICCPCAKSEPELARQKQWISRLAIRGVCESIIANGYATFPIKVQSAPARSIISVDLTPVCRRRPSLSGKIIAFKPKAAA
jgi:hypothetical protein